jgi:hypothetical protein
MVRCLANSILEFHNTKTGEKVVTKMGFNQFPDWVGENHYYKQAVKFKHLTEFEGSADKTLEQITIDSETAAKLKDDIKALEEKKERSLTDGNVRIGALKDEIAELEARKAELDEATISHNNTSNKNKR